jgi:hypothetical protein
VLNLPFFSVTLQTHLCQSGAEENHARKIKVPGKIGLENQAVIA